MGSWLETVYRYCPTWVQNAGIAAYGLAWKKQRMGGEFLTQVAQFRGREGYTADEWRGYQTSRLRDLLRWCFQQVPHYQRAWSQVGLEARDLETFEPEDLPRLPITEKEEIRRQPGDFLATSVPAGRLHTSLTSGSTGTPLAIRMTSVTHQKMYAAYEARCRRWAGVDYTVSRGMIGGRMVVPRAVTRPPFWRYNPPERQLYLSAFHIAPANVPDYVRALNHYRPDYLVGYASAHFFLARMIEEAGLEVYSPRVILTSSEQLTDEMRATLQRVYRCPVFDAYSGVESCCLASECEHHRLHVSPDVGIMELVDREGSPVPIGQEGEIVATGLLNFDQPLVRYRTGDLAVWSEERCPCGRAMPLLRELVGRLEDTVIGPDGRETVRFHGIFVGLTSVRQGQIVQEAYDRFTVRVVATQPLTPAERNLILTRFRERLGPVRVEIEPVAAIERTARGKFRAVISQVPRASAQTPNQLAPFR
jgi:phenylacetate-CoA ligase